MQMSIFFLNYYLFNYYWGGGGRLQHQFRSHVASCHVSLSMAYFYIRTLMVECTEMKYFSPVIFISHASDVDQSTLAQTENISRAFNLIPMNMANIHRFIFSL